jgi:hypothetical protein
VTPTCCGKRARSYVKTYARHSVESGWACRVCNRIRIPSGEPFDNSEWHAEIKLLQERVALEEKHLDTLSHNGIV